MVPLLLILVFGIIEFGIIFNTKLVITSAAREGARKAAVTSVQNEVETAIENSLASLNANLSGPDIRAKGSSMPPDNKTVWWYIETPEGGSTGNPVYVYVKGRVDIFVPVISSLVGTSVQIPASTMMRIEHH